jgi:hypothetical protein
MKWSVNLREENVIGVLCVILVLSLHFNAWNTPFKENVSCADPELKIQQPKIWVYSVMLTIVACKKNNGVIHSRRCGASPSHNIALESGN